MEKGAKKEVEKTEIRSGNFVPCIQLQKISKAKKSERRTHSSTNRPEFNNRNQLIDRPNNHSPTSLPTEQQNRSTNQPTDQLVDQWTNQPTHRPTERLTN